MAAYHNRKASANQTLAGPGAPMIRTKPNERAHVQERLEAKKTKTKVVYIEQKKKPLDIRYDTASVPENYQVVEYGNKDVIEFLLDQSRKAGFPVWVANNALPGHKSTGNAGDTTKLSHHVGRVGYHFHKGLVAKARKLYNLPLQKPKVKKFSHGKTIKVTKQDHEKGLVELYPHMPDRDRQTVLRSLTTKGTKIGKATGTMNVYKQIELAVIAHVRHSHTDYEKLIYMSGKPAARSAVESQISAKLAEWRGEDGKHVDENETELVEYEEDTSSESVESIVIIEDDDEGDYSPPPAEQHVEQHTQSLASIDTTRTWQRPSEVEGPRSSGLRPAPPRFGTDHFDEYSFDYRYERPQQYVQPRGYESREPPHVSLMPFPILAQNIEPPRIQLRPLPPSSTTRTYHRDMIPPSHNVSSRGNEPYRHRLEDAPPARPISYEHAPPQHIYRRNSPRPMHSHVPVHHIAQPEYAYLPRQQYPPVPPPRSAHSHSYVAQPMSPPKPTIRYRPLSPDDVIPSRELFSPLQDNRKRAMPDDWDDYAPNGYKRARPVAWNSYEAPRPHY